MNASDGNVPGECLYAQENMEGFVLAALDPSDQSRVANHVRWCDDCRPFHTGLQRVVDMLPYATPSTLLPSPAVRAALLDRVQHHRTREMDGTGVPVNAAARPGIAAFGTRDRLQEAQSAPVQMVNASESSRLGWAKWVPTAFIAPLLVALIVVSAWGIGQRNQVNEMQQQLHAQSNANFAKSGSATRLFTTRPACPSCTGSGQLGADPADNKAFLLAWDLNPDEQHEIWCVHPDGKSNLVAVLNVNQKGQVMQNLEFSQPISGYREIRIVRHDDASPELIIAVAASPEGLELKSLGSPIDR